MSEPAIPLPSPVADQTLPGGFTEDCELVDLVPMPMWIGDERGRVLYHNRAWQEFSGRPPADDLDDGWLELVHPEDRAHVDAHLAVLVQEGREVTFEYRARRTDGEFRLLREHSRGRHDAQGRLRGLAGTRADITDGHETQETLRQQQTQKMEALGLLAGGVAHDFNNLLTAIRCFGELLREDLTRDADRAKMDDILHAASHATHLVRQLLTFSRKTVQEPESIELNQLLEDLRSFIRSLLSETIAIEIEPSSEPAYIRADRNQIEQVIFNLCLNARDAMTSGGQLTLSVDRCEVTPELNPRLTPGKFAVLRVADNGSGIPTDVQGRVFEPFFTTKGHGRGTGLGLSTCMSICRAFGGDISVVSAPGVGTEFTVLLPESIPVKIDDFEEDIPDVHPGGGRLMVVDDDDLVRAVATSLLEALGHTVITFPSSEAALEYAQTPEFATVQVLVTDIIMPVMNGHELSRRLTAIKPDLKTLFMSGYIEDQSIQTAVLDSNVSFLAKPFSTAELADRVTKLLP